MRFQAYLQVPDVGIPVGRAGHDPVGLRRPINAGHSQVVLIQCGRLCVLSHLVAFLVHLSNRVRFNDFLVMIVEIFDKRTLTSLLL